jgi:hypothetical protein
MESYLSGDFERLAQLLAEVRLELRERGVKVRPEAWQGAIDGDLRDLVAAGRHDEAKARLLSVLEAAPELKT